MNAARELCEFESKEFRPSGGAVFVSFTFGPFGTEARI